MELRLRPMHLTDVGQVPGDCFGSHDTLVSRIRDLGSAAVLAYDGPQHVAQLQFRRYDPKLRSTEGIWHPNYWGDFGAEAPELPKATLNVFCYHVGQLRSGDERNPEYLGKGIGLALLDYFLNWAQDQQFSGVVAKFTPENRAVMGFMGGQPAAAYAARGFEIGTSWLDRQLANAVIERKLVPPDANPDDTSRVGVCYKPFC